MTTELQCYRCGAALAELTPPLSRQDECPSCSVYLHVCRMCIFFDPNVPKQCTEDDAEEVFEKERANFCDWFVPGCEAFDPQSLHAEEKAKTELADLFGESESKSAGTDPLLSEAENLFK